MKLVDYSNFENTLQNIRQYFDMQYTANALSRTAGRGIVFFTGNKTSHFWFKHTEDSFSVVVSKSYYQSVDRIGRLSQLEIHLPYADEQIKQFIDLFMSTALYEKLKYLSESRKKMKVEISKMFVDDYAHWGFADHNFYFSLEDQVLTMTFQNTVGVKDEFIIYNGVYEDYEQLSTKFIKIDVLEKVLFLKLLKKIREYGVFTLGDIKNPPQHTEDFKESFNAQLHDIGSFSLSLSY